MLGEHPFPFGRASGIIAAERAGLNIFLKTPQMDQLEANQIAGVRHFTTLDHEGEPTNYKQNPHDE